MIVRGTDAGLAAKSGSGLSVTFDADLRLQTGAINMTVSEMNPAWFPAFGITELLLMTGAALIGVRTVSLRLKFWAWIEAAVLTAAALLLGQSVADLSHQTEGSYPYSWFALQVRDMDCRSLILFHIILGVLEICFIVFLNRKSRSGLSQDAVKEAMDALTDGISFYEENGAPLLVNERMNQICADVSGMHMMNADRFWKSINEKRDPELEGQIVPTSDGKLWSFTRKFIRLEKEKTQVQEITAYNATEEIRLLRQQRERKQLLEQIHERLSRYGREVLHTTREKEILAAKIRIHDKVGQCLLAYRAYLAWPDQERNREKLLRMWEETALVLYSEANTPDRPDEWKLLQEAAAAVDVEIRAEGEIPREGEARELLIMAIHECLTNTVKHADGDCLTIHITYNKDKLFAELTNTGNPPKEEIHETGGLGSLRARVTQAGGQMQVEAVPRFRLLLTLSLT